MHYFQGSREHRPSLGGLTNRRRTLTGYRLKPQWVHKTGCAASALYAIVQGVAAHQHYNRKSSSMSKVIISLFMTEDRSGRSLIVIS